VWGTIALEFFCFRKKINKLNKFLETKLNMLLYNNFDVFDNTPKADQYISYLGIGALRYKLIRNNTK
jgi:hypothetical protein